MSPIVIRKELESLLVQEGEKVLREVNFINEHADLYWNLFYGKYLRNFNQKLNFGDFIKSQSLHSKFEISAFQRIGVRHKLDQLLPNSSILAPVDPADDDSGSHSLKEKSNEGFFC